MLYVVDGVFFARLVWLLSSFLFQSDWVDFCNVSSKASVLVNSLPQASKEREVGKEKGPNQRRTLSPSTSPTNIEASLTETIRDTTYIRTTWEDHFEVSDARYHPYDRSAWLRSAPLTVGSSPIAPKLSHIDHRGYFNILLSLVYSSTHPTAQSISTSYSVSLIVLTLDCSSSSLILFFFLSPA